MSERDDNPNGDAGGGRPGIPLEPSRLLQAMRAGWVVVFAATVIGAFAGAYIAKKVVKQSFEATAVLAWESGAPDLVTRQTTLESVALGSNLAYVAKEMGLSMPISAVANFFVVTSNENSNIIKIRSFWASADGAAEMANLLMYAFMESRGKVARERLEATIRRHKAAVQEAERRSIAAAQGYEAFRREKGFSDISQEKEIAITAAAEAAAAAETARRKAEAAKAAYEAFADDDEDTGPVMSDAERKEAKLDLERLPVLQSELAQKRVEFAEDHPTVMRLKSMLAALEARIKARGDIPSKHGSESERKAKLKKKAEEAEEERKQAEAASAVLQATLEKLSEAEGQAALLLGEIGVAKKILEEAKQELTDSEVVAQDPPAEFRVLEQATPPDVAMSSPRKKVALGVPAALFLVSLIGVVLWGLRRGRVVTPKEAAFWAGVPVIGASTWPREPHMLAGLMHDLDDFAAQSQGLTLTIGFSAEETALLAAQGSGSDLVLRDAAMAPEPAQALRRAARSADRVMVVVMSGAHSFLQLSGIKDQLGRDDGVGILLVGLPREFATVRDRVGDVAQFWRATRPAGGSQPTRIDGSASSGV